MQFDDFQKAVAGMRFVVLVQASGTTDIFPWPGPAIEYPFAELTRLVGADRCTQKHPAAIDAALLGGGPGWIVGAESSCIVADRRTMLAGLTGEPVPLNDMVTSITGTPVYGTAAVFGIRGADWVGASYEKAVALQSAAHLLRDHGGPHGKPCENEEDAVLLAGAQRRIKRALTHIDDTRDALEDKSRHIPNHPAPKDLEKE